MLVNEIVTAFVAALAVGGLLWLAAHCLMQATATGGALGRQLAAGAAALAALATWWPAHLAQAESLLVRAGWVPPLAADLAPPLLGVFGAAAAYAWQHRRRAWTAALALAATALAWTVLEADPHGTPAVPGLMPVLMALPLAAALTLTFLFNGHGRLGSFARSGAAAAAAAILAYGGWRSAAQDRFGFDASGADWGMLLIVLAMTALMLHTLEARGGPALRPARKRARVDGLTGLPMRHHFETRLARAKRDCETQGGTLAVLQINLDSFKRVNDVHGFQTGDHVLEEVARRLQRIARADDTVARLAGNDFLLLATGIGGAAAAEEVAQRVVESIAKPCPVDGVEIGVTASVGVALWPGVARATRLIGSAELAMREARRRGGGRHFVYTPALEGEGASEGDMVHELRHAIATQGLELHFQPKIDVQSGKVTGAEALVRWRHPRRGMIAPDEFIPLAERSGLIGPLGDWVIEEACRQSRIWRDAGLRMRVAINLSAHQMQQEDIVQRIGQSLERHRVHPSLLTCEITESAAMQDTRMTQETFRQLGKMGVHVSIDDFGTGYSSLAYLRRLPAEELKIDRAFVTDLDHSEDALAVVDAVVRLAQALGLKVVAEGVETPRQRQILAELGCDEMQGYLFARPMTARALLMWAINDKQSTKFFKGSLFANTMEAPSNMGASRRAMRRALADTVIAPRTKEPTR